MGAGLLQGSLQQLRVCARHVSRRLQERSPGSHAAPSGGGRTSRASKVRQSLPGIRARACAGPPLTTFSLLSLSSLNPSPHLASLSIYLTLSLCLSRSIYLCLCLSVSHSFSSPTTGPALSDGVSVFPHWQQEVKGISIMPLFVGDKVRQQEADAHTGAYRERETARAGERDRERERERLPHTQHNPYDMTRHEVNRRPTPTGRQRYSGTTSR